MDNLRDCAGLFVYREGPVRMADFDPVFLPNEVLLQAIAQNKEVWQKTV